MLADSVFIIRRNAGIISLRPHVPIDGCRSQASTAFDRCQQSATESPLSTSRAPGQRSLRMQKLGFRPPICDPSSNGVWGYRRVPLLVAAAGRHENVRALKRQSTEFPKISRAAEMIFGLVCQSQNRKGVYGGQSGNSDYNAGRPLLLPRSAPLRPRRISERSRLRDPTLPLPP
jgi:hypothetical protein